MHLSDENTKRKRPTILIGLDAAEPSLIEKWTSEGKLPTLKKLIDRGTYSRLESTSRWYSGSVWPTFYSGKLPSFHNIYHCLQWNPLKMKIEPPNQRWLPVQPFWRKPEFKKISIAALDIPMTYETEPVNGLEISGLVTNDRISENSFYPKTLENWVYSKIGKPPILLEPHGSVDADILINLKKLLIKSIEYVEKLALNVLDKASPDLFLMCFSATHTAGHKFWNLSQIKNELSEFQQNELNNSLLDIYSACDAAISNILNRINVDHNVIVFSLHGMGLNNSKSPILDSMLSRIINLDPGISIAKKYLMKLRSAIPNKYRHYFKSRMPLELQGDITNFWRKQDYKNTPIINMVMDLQGYLNINLAGRERDGIILQGKEYDDLCMIIIEGLHSFKEKGTGSPLIENIVQSKEIFPTDKEWYFLPDLVINWTVLENNYDFMAFSPVYGELEWPTPGYSPDGRSGNHRFEGFIIANLVDNNNKDKDISGHIVDLAPTIYKLLGIPVPSDMSGKPLF